MAKRGAVRKAAKRTGNTAAGAAKFRKAQKAFVKKKTAEGSAFGLSDRDNAAMKRKRLAASKQAKQAGGDGRLGLGGVKKLRPKKSKKK